MTDKHTRLEVAQAALAIALSLPWVLVSEAFESVLSLGHKPVLMP